MAALTFTTVTLPQLAKGDKIRVTTSPTAKAAGEELVGSYIGQASTGLRVRVDGKVVTRAVSRIVKLEREEELTAAPAAPAAVEPVAEAAKVGTVDAEDIRVALEEVAAEVAAERAETPQDAPAEAAPAVAVQAPAPAAESAEGDVYDADPMVDGKHLSQMKFAEVMVLAKRYKTPGRGVARIAALRDGVAKAIAAEAGRLAGASA